MDGVASQYEEFLEPWLSGCYRHQVSCETGLHSTQHRVTKPGISHHPGKSRSAGQCPASGMLRAAAAPPACLAGSCALLRPHVWHAAHVRHNSHPRMRGQGHGCMIRCWALHAGWCTPVPHCLLVPWRLPAGSLHCPGGMASFDPTGSQEHHTFAARHQQLHGLLTFNGLSTHHPT